MFTNYKQKRNIIAYLHRYCPYKRTATCNKPQEMSELEFLNALKKIDLSKVGHRKILQFIKSNDLKFPILTTLIKKGAIIERGRKSDFGEFYNSEFEITYRTDLGNILTYGRANHPHQSMFYGCLPTKSIPRPTITLLSELFWFESLKYRNFKTSVTIGRWVVKKDFEVADVCYGAEYLSNQENMERFKFWERNLSNEITDTKYNKSLLRFFSSEFSKTSISMHFDYKISSVYTDLALFENLKGVMYPSVRTEYDGKNLAIIPSTVDECLELKEVAVFDYQIANNQPRAVNTRYSDDLGFLNSNFQWKKQYNLT